MPQAGQKIAETFGLGSEKASEAAGGAQGQGAAGGVGQIKQEVVGKLTEAAKAAFDAAKESVMQK